MRRRGNKSHKVPNVKLRPAEKGSIPQPAVESVWAQETQPGSDDTAVFDLCPRPLKGVVICATGVADKPTLFKQAVELGATPTPAFTDLVTHLIATEHGGAKYNCALKRKTPIMKPSWITENYKIWLRGDDVDVQKSVEEHRLPIFSGVVVCPSGITDILRRTKISKLVEQHQGSYLRQLERPVRVTHLLCSGDDVTDKMSKAEKFNKTGEARIHLVWEEWFWDSLDFGGRFDEGTYQVKDPRPERKSLPEAATPPPASSDVGSQHDEAPSSSAVPKPPQNNPDDAEDEPAFVNVLPAVTLQLWGTLLGRRGYQVVDGEVLLSPSKDKGKAQSKQLPLPDSPTRQEIPAGGSVISSFRRVNSFAPVNQPKPPGTSRQFFRRAATASAALNNPKAGPSTNTGQPQPAAGPTSAAAGPSGSAKSSQIFAGMTFRALGEAKSVAVRGAVEQLGGRMSTDEDEDVTFIIVRLVSGSKLYRQEEDEALRQKYRTECWLEHCIYGDRICPPEEQLSFVPLSIPIPVNGAEGVVMSLSGFEQSESYTLKRLLRALGITLASTFSRRSTHLLCPSGTGLKFEKAHEWGVPVINADWLGAMASSGRIPEVHDFLVAGSFVPPLPEDTAMKVDRRDLKGKGKAVDESNALPTKAVDVGAMDVDAEGTMNDITNNTPLDGDSQKARPVAKKTKTTVERQATTCIGGNLDSEPREKRAMFGEPTVLLGRASSSFFEQQHYSSLPDVESSTRSLVGLRHDDSTTEESAGAIQGLDSINRINPPSRKASLRRQSTTLTLDDEGLAPDGSVPSSKSPSPMKLPLQKSGSTRLSLSPVKIDHEATKALQDSITSLLGKRPSPDSDELGSVGGADGGAHAKGQAGRNGKRARPQRPKSRQTSDAQIGASSKPSVKPRTRSSNKAAAAPPQDAVNTFGSFPDDLNIADQESQAESMRVMYEDPGQREEQKRLMSLLGGKSGEKEPESMTLSASRGVERLTRRSSTRIPGF